MAYKLRIETNNPLLVKPFECSVCLKDMWTQVTLSCGHKYHYKCINSWFQYQKNCPYCRHPFSPPASPAGRPPPPPLPPQSRPSTPLGPPSPVSSAASSELYEDIPPTIQCVGCFAWVQRLRRRRRRLLPTIS